MDSDLQNKLLADPRVKDAIAKAGQDAMKDPAVQQKIKEVAMEKGPEYAQKAAEQMQAWASDPEVQAKAYYYAGTAAKYAGTIAAGAGDSTITLIEQGPAGVRVLAFAAGCLSCTVAVMSIMDIGKHLFNPAGLLVSGYQIVFSLTTMVFEAPASVVTNIPGITKYQDMLIEHCKFISEVMGRGLFYLFQGSLWLTFAGLDKMLHFVAGIVLVAVGALHVVMYFGGLQEVATKMRGGYDQIASSA